MNPHDTPISVTSHPRSNLARPRPAPPGDLAVVENHRCTQVGDGHDGPPYSDWRLLAATARGRHRFSVP
jgi:hypothetical protein